MYFHIFLFLNLGLLNLTANLALFVVVFLLFLSLRSGPALREARPPTSEACPPPPTSNDPYHQYTI